MTILLLDGYCQRWNWTTQCFLRRVSWGTSRRHIWCPDHYVCWLQLPFCGRYPPTSSRGYDWQYEAGIEWWWRDAAPGSKKLPDDENRLPQVRKKTSKEDYQAAAIAWMDPKLCSWSLYRLWAMCCCWWICSLARWALSHCESSRCRLLGQ